LITYRSDRHPTTARVVALPLPRRATRPRADRSSLTGPPICRRAIAEWYCARHGR